MAARGYVLNFAATSKEAAMPGKSASVKNAKANEALKGK
jgi:hypothetical protein